jgi:hypothetical protein
MGEMADWHDGYDEEFDYLYVTHDEIREFEWVTKDGTRTKIKNMTDTHLLNAYKQTREENLFEEMVVRLFENFTKPRLGL